MLSVMLIAHGYSQSYYGEKEKKKKGPATSIATVLFAAASLLLVLDSAHMDPTSAVVCFC